MVDGMKDEIGMFVFFSRNVRDKGTSIHLTRSKPYLPILWHLTEQSRLFFKKTGRKETWKW